MREVKDPEDVKPVLLSGYLVPSSLRDEVHGGHFPGMSWALVASAAEIENNSPGDRPTLGADGLGLHLFCRRIHDASGRRLHLPCAFVRCLLLSCCLLLYPCHPRRRRRQRQRIVLRGLGLILFKIL